MQKDESVLIIYMLHVEQQQEVLFQRNACDVYVIDVFVEIWQSAKCEQTNGCSQRYVDSSSHQVRYVNSMEQLQNGSYCSHFRRCCFEAVQPLHTRTICIDLCRCVCVCE